jgi:RNA-directed DNA polymerase
MDNKRQNNQYLLACLYGLKGESPASAETGTELPMAKRGSQSPTDAELTMEEICRPANILEALRKVRSNKGKPGVDGMTVHELPEYLKSHWRQIGSQLLSGTYKPQPVRRVEIPKPGGGVRKLGIPTVLDRLIQQAVLQVLQGKWDKTFSESSFGFRPGRSAHQAVEKAQKYVAQGHGWVVDIDLEKFFDKVNHDRLMSRIADREKDKRLLKLIRAFLNAGVMENGLVSPIDEGTPQGGPLSPLLSNLVLDELDKTLEARGLCFVRYADDCNIYVKSEKAGHRVMKGVSLLISRKLKLKVNESKSAVAKPAERKFLGFSIKDWLGQGSQRCIAPKALERFKDRVRELTEPSKGVSLEQLARPLSQYLRGWRGYFGFSQTPSVLRALDSWIRRRLRNYVLKSWSRSRTHEANRAYPNAYWDQLGIPRVSHPTGG